MKTYIPEVYIKITCNQRLLTLTSLAGEILCILIIGKLVINIENKYLMRNLQTRFRIEIMLVKYSDFITQHNVGILYVLGIITFRTAEKL